jgi:hypothetical protein
MPKVSKQICGCGIFIIIDIIAYQFRFYFLHSSPPFLGGTSAGAAAVRIERERSGEVRLSPPRRGACAEVVEAKIINKKYFTHKNIISLQRFALFNQLL